MKEDLPRRADGLARAGCPASSRQGADVRKIRRGTVAGFGAFPSFGRTGAAGVHQPAVFIDVEVGIAADEEGQLCGHEADGGVFPLVAALVDDLRTCLVDGEGHA